MTDEDLISRLTDVQALAGTMWSEAAGDRREGNSSVEERLAVGCVIRTRLSSASKFGASEATYRGVCLAHSAKGTYQFDCWRPNSGVNHARLMVQVELTVLGHGADDAIFRETLFLAQGIIDGTIVDQTKGANFYYAPKSMVPPGSVPSWAREKTAVVSIGDQLFFKL